MLSQAAKAKQGKKGNLRTYLLDMESKNPDEFCKHLCNFATALLGFLKKTDSDTLQRSISANIHSHLSLLNFVELIECAVCGFKFSA